MRAARIELAGGLRLFAAETGSGSGVLLLHGFTGSADTWQGLARHLARRGLRAVAVDLVGHARSDAPEDAERYSFARCTADLLELADRLGLGRFGLVGYSLGGRVALHLALAAPRRVAALVLESCSPGIPDPEERALRRRRDEALADAIERDGLEAFVAYWEAQPLFATQARLPARTRARLRAQRLGHAPGGLARVLRGLGAGVQEPLWGRLGELGMPVLLVAGAEDTRYAAIARAMAEAIPRASLRVIPRAGHAVHLERPRLFCRAVADFLCRHLPGGSGSTPTMHTA